MTLIELIEVAEQYKLVDSWGRIGDTIVLRLSTMTVDLDEEKAKPFVRGLLRGFEVAQELDGES